MQVNVEIVLSILSGGEKWRLLRKPSRIMAAAIWEIRPHRPYPPVYVKHRIIRDYARRHGLRTFVETGTALGDTIFEMRRTCRSIYSIDVSRAMAEDARRRFASYPHIHIIEGDSSAQLPAILSAIDEPSLFWLDAHYVPESRHVTGGDPQRSPILDELCAIFSHRVREHVILVDDAREFNGSHGYPSLHDLEDLVAERGNGYSMTVAKDVIRILPEESTERESDRKPT